MKPEISAVILAGGLGSRMGMITEEVPKSMLEVEGKPVISHILDGLHLAFGSTRVVIATGYKSEVIRDFYKYQYGSSSIEYVHSSEHLEIRRRLLLTDGLIKGPFFVIGSDVLVDPTHYSSMAHIYDSREVETYGVISGATDLTPAPTHAVISADGDSVTGIQTYPPLNLRESVLRDMSLWLFDQKTLDLLKQAPITELNISPVLNSAIKQGIRYVVARYNGIWYHFGVPEDLNAELTFIQEGKHE